MTGYQNFEMLDFVIFLLIFCFMGITVVVIAAIMGMYRPSNSARLATMVVCGKSSIPLVTHETQRTRAAFNSSESDIS